MLSEQAYSKSCCSEVAECASLQLGGLGMVGEPRASSLNMQAAALALMVDC